jgi:predicted regulator of Ras-like GTPase activity (Roadblock/LC7/MglB family)
MLNSGKSGSEILANILRNMNQQGNFPMSVLTDKEGLPIASAFSNGSDPDRQSAVVAFLQKTAIQVSRQLGMEEIEEISFKYVDGQHLVCRPVNIDTSKLILAFNISDRDQSYRRTPNHAVAAIRQVWKQF